MTPLEQLLEPLRHSPELPQAIEALQKQLDEERKRRSKFYADMTPEQKVEFIDGEVVMHSPAKNKHLIVTGNTFILLKTFVAKNKLGSVRTEKCLTVFPRNDYEPDIVFFGKEKAAGLTDDTMKFPVPDLIVEVLSPSTEDRDRGIKFDDYAANGVGEYWIIDPDEESVEQYLLKGREYSLHAKSGNGEIESRVIADLKIPIAALFSEKENLRALEGLMGDR